MQDCEVIVWFLKSGIVFMRQIILFGTIADGKVVLDHQKIFEVYLRSFKKSTRIELVVGPIRKDKTTQQLRYFHGVIAAVFSEETGYTKEAAKGILKRTFLTKNRNTKGEYVPSLSELSVQEMSDFIDSCCLWLAENGIYVPEASPDL